MGLPLYADECVDHRIVTGLRRRAVNIITAAEQGLLGASDERHFERASELGRVVLRCDHDFLRLVQDRLDRAASFAGLVFILPATPVGEAVRAAALIATVLEPEEMLNRIEWVP